MADIHCIFLDMGKVLLDFDFQRLADAMHSLTGCDPNSLRSAMTGGDLAVRFELGQIDSSDFHSEICRLLGAEISFESFVSAYNSIFLQTPNLPDETLAALSHRAALWVLSNTNRIHFSFIRDSYSFLRFFRGCVLSCDAGAMKPDPRIYHYALKKAGVKASEALFVDDHLPNVEAAASLGIEAFQFLSPTQFREEMRTRELL